MPESHQLTELQIALLRVLWDRREATVVEICEALRPERTLAQTTVATLLSRLERRGVVTHRTVARQYVYAPAVSEDAVGAAAVAAATPWSGSLPNSFSRRCHRTGSSSPERARNQRG